MGEKIIVGNISKGIENTVTPFNIDNDAFPVLVNAYQHRKKVKRKRGTTLLNRLKRFFNSTSTSYSSTSTFALIAGAGNILTGFSLETFGNIVPGSVTIINVTVAQTYTDAAMDGTLNGNLGGTGTINYATGAITITGGAGNSVSAQFLYYPDLPVMGLEELRLNVNQPAKTLGFDTTYSYNILTTYPYNIYDVSFYKNPPTGDYTNYVQKTDITPTSWNGADYMQFYTVNYAGALWATNGITQTFNASNIGMQFKAIVTVTVLTPTTASLNILTHGLVVGDFVFINEVVTTTGINFQTGYVTTVTDANNVIVTFPNAAIATNGTGGIAQYLTSRSSTTKDCLRWYDGDPTDGSHDAPVLNGRKGWVNFCPPLSRSNFSIGNLPAAQYYLVGARVIYPFKDRLLFFGVVVQTSTGTPIYLQDTIVYSQNGTPYYTASFSTDPSLPTTTFNPILVPTNQTATSNAYWADQTGFGGFQTIGIDQAIKNVESNTDVLIVGLDNTQTKLVYTGNDILPFNFYIIDSELGTSSTFSSINMGDVVFSRGDRGIIMTNQNNADRVDLPIIDEVFQMKLEDHGPERVCSQRDYINEWIYLSYSSNQVRHKFPSQTLLFNYRENTWGLFKENYTTYGSFRKSTGFTWATVGSVFPTWREWNQPWNAGSSTLLQPDVIAGNQQGFVIFREDGDTGEDNSLYIRSISAGVITSPDHCLNQGDYIIIDGCKGTISSLINGKIFSVGPGVTQNTFSLNPPLGTGTYLGGGLITKMYDPFIQTKQFPVSWGMARKTRLGVQQYLLSITENSQVSLLIFLSQDNSTPYNAGPFYPDVNAFNNGLIYSTILYTCPESTNLGLTAANVNLQMPTASQQAQIWHRINTSLIGDTIQVGISLSDAQMRSFNQTAAALTITGATQANPCVLTCDNTLSAGQMVKISGVVGMTQLNFVESSYNIYKILSRNATTITIDVDASAFTAYSSGGILTPIGIVDQFAEIELHQFILDCNPSQLLA